MARSSCRRCRRNRGKSGDCRVVGGRGRTAAALVGGAPACAAASSVGVDVDDECRLATSLVLLGGGVGGHDDGHAWRPPGHALSFHRLCPGSSTTTILTWRATGRRRDGGGDLTDGGQKAVGQDVVGHGRMPLAGCSWRRAMLRQGLGGAHEGDLPAAQAARVRPRRAVSRRRRALRGPGAQDGGGVKVAVQGPLCAPGCSRPRPRRR